MKVLWFTNILLPDACRHLARPVGTSGWWMTSLLERLKRRRDIQLAIVAEGGLRDQRFTVDGVEYFVAKTPWRRGIWNRLGSSREVVPVRSQIEKFARIVNEWKTQIIHVHGTESGSGFGLIKALGLTDKPMLVSIQGLMAPCAAKAYGDQI